MKGKQYNLSVDIFKIICAVLVITIHTAPLVEISPFTNYLLVQVLGRIAVPSFFALSGYYFYQKYHQAEDKEKYLQQYCRKMLLLYLLVSAVYIPIWIYANLPVSNILVLNLLKDIFLDGFHYHLWYFPALIVGTVLVCLLEKYQPKKAGKIVIGLYLIGSLLNVYFLFFSNITGVTSIAIEYSRNGLFFAPVFLYCGFHLKKINPKSKHLLFVGILYLLECLILHGTGHYNSVTSMYLSLLILIPILLQHVINNKKALHSNQQLHALSNSLYILHPLVIIGITKLYSLADMEIPNILLFLLTLVVTTVVSLIIKLCIIYFQKARDSKQEIPLQKDSI